MDMYRTGTSEHLQRERCSLNSHLRLSTFQQEDFEHLKNVEHQREELEKKCDELQLKCSEIEQREKDLRMKAALDAYGQLCLNVGIEGRSSIRQLLVNLCQTEFERNFEVELMLKARSKKIAQADKEVRSELEALFEKEFHFAQTQAQGNIWMIGELYNYGILSDNMVLYFISRLLDEMSGVSWLWLCELILTVHASLVKNEVAVDKYYVKIKEIFKSKTHLSNNSETLLQNIILDWEAKADPESIEALGEEKLPDSEPVVYKPIVCTVQSYDKPNLIAEHTRFRHFNNRQLRGGKSRGRYRGERGFGNGSYPSDHTSLPVNLVDSYSYSDWYEQNMCTAYGLPKHRPFAQVPSDGYGQYGMRQGRLEQDMREQKMKKRPRQQQNQNKAQESNFTSKKELLDGEMKIGFRKQTQKKLAEAEKKSPVHQNNAAQHSTTATNKQVPVNAVVCKPADIRESNASPQQKLWSALGASIDDDDEPTCTDNQSDNKNTTSKNTQVPAKMNTKVPKSKTGSSAMSVKTERSDEDADVLILSETLSEVKVREKVVFRVDSPKDKRASSVIISDDEKPEGEVPCEYSSGTSEYSSPMESPVPSEKSNEVWTRLALLPQPRGTTPTSADDAVKAED